METLKLMTQTSKVLTIYNNYKIKIKNDKNINKETEIETKIDLNENENENETESDNTDNDNNDNIDNIDGKEIQIEKDVKNEKKYSEFTVNVNWGSLGVVLKMERISDKEILPKIVNINNIETYKHGIRKNMYIVYIDYQWLNGKSYKELKQILNVFQMNQNRVWCKFKKRVKN